MRPISFPVCNFLVPFLLWPILAFSQGTFPEGFGATLIQDNLNPVGMTIDHHGRIWLLEKHGDVRIVDESGNFLPEPFIQLSVDDFNERGLLGIALHPDLDNEPYVYLYYTVPGENHNRLSRFTANGDLAVPGSETILLELDSLSGPIHNGGSLSFGLDGKLYIATGDGTHAPNAGNLNNLLGKILRINPDGTIPDDNPFYEEAEGKYRAIWAYGLRNPFSIAIDQETGRLFACDVGQGDFEEINDIEPGKNYGWPLVEGYWQEGNPPDDYKDPHFSYTHEEGCAVVGASFYQPHASTFPETYQHKFFFADYCNGSIQFLHPENGLLEGTFATEVVRPLAFVVNEENGDFYYLSRAGIGNGSPQDNTSTEMGSLWRVFYNGSGEPIISVNPSPLFLGVGEDATFSIHALGAPELSFQWQKDEINIPGATSAELIYSAVTLADNGALFRCIVTNEVGSVTSTPAELLVVNSQRPTVSILEPLNNTLFKAGDTISYSGLASDPEDGLIPADKLCWSIDLHHNEHTHPALTLSCGQANGTFIVPKVTETDTNVWFRVYLTAEDESGLTNNSFTEIFPEIIDVEVEGPSGIVVNIDGKIRTLPLTFRSMSNLQRIIQAPLTQRIGDSIYLFRAWADGSTDLLKTFFATPDNLAQEILYDAFPLGNGNGLLAKIFEGTELEAGGQLLEERIDTIIDFDFGDGGPLPEMPLQDNFSIRWEGEVQAIFPGEYTFYTRTDDGVRLWVGEELIVDQWVPQATTEHSGTFMMEAGTRYPIKMEYFEQGGFADARLQWSNALIPKETIPQRQLYYSASKLEGFCWLDENFNEVFDAGEQALPFVTVALLGANDGKLIASTQTDAQGAWVLNGIIEGEFYLQFTPTQNRNDLLPFGGLDRFGATPTFMLDRNVTLAVNAPFLSLSSNISFGITGAQLFPNPGIDKLGLRIFLSAAQDLDFSLFDLAGHELLNRKVFLAPGKHVLEFPTKNLVSGLYILQINDGVTIHSYKWVKARNE